MFRHIYREWLECPRHRPEYPFFVGDVICLIQTTFRFRRRSQNRHTTNTRPTTLNSGENTVKMAFLIPYNPLSLLFVKLSKNDQNFTSSAMISSHGERTQSRETHLWPFFRQQTRRNDYLRIFALNTTAQLST
jgi:hypothetical protein